MKKILNKCKEISKKSFIHPLFILLFIWFIISKRLLSFLTFIFVLLIHESGHYIFAKRLGYKLSRFRLLPFGAELNYAEKLFDNRDEILISFAGPFFNIVSSILIVCFWWIFPSIYSFTYTFVFESMMLALLNFLPAYPLDGGRLFLGIMNDRFSRKKSLKILKFMNVLFAGLFIVFFIITCFANYNPTFILMSVFLLSGLLEINSENRYELLALNKKLDKNFCKINLKNVNSNTRIIDILKQIETRKKTIFFIKNKNIMLTEEQLIKLTLIYPLDAKIDDIVKKK